MASDLGIGLSTLNKGWTAHRDSDVVSDLARENALLRRENRILKEERGILKRQRTDMGVLAHIKEQFRLSLGPRWSSENDRKVEKAGPEHWPLSGWPGDTRE